MSQMPKLGTKVLDILPKGHKSFTQITPYRGHCYLGLSLSHPFQTDADDDGFQEKIANMTCEIKVKWFILAQCAQPMPRPPPFRRSASQLRRTVDIPHSATAVCLDHAVLNHVRRCQMRLTSPKRMKRVLSHIRYAYVRQPRRKPPPQCYL